MPLNKNEKCRCRHIGGTGSFIVSARLYQTKLSADQAEILVAGRSARVARRSEVWIIGSIAETVVALFGLCGRGRRAACPGDECEFVAVEFTHKNLHDIWPQRYDGYSSNGAVDHVICFKFAINHVNFLVP